MFEIFVFKWDHPLALNEIKPHTTSNDLECIALIWCACSLVKRNNPSQLKGGRLCPIQHVYACS